MAPSPAGFSPCSSGRAPCGRRRPLLALSLILYGLVIRASATLPSWAGWLAMAAGAIVLVSFAPLGGTPPFVIYLLATLPLGVVAVLRVMLPQRRTAEARL